MSAELPIDLSVVLGALLLAALLAVAVATFLLRRTRRSAQAHELSLRQELTRLEQGRAELERTSYTDPLTGIWNYRYLQLALDREVARCARQAQSERAPGAAGGASATAAAGTTGVPGPDRLAVLLLEIDGFDGIRRDHGHQRCGAVLRDLAQRLAMEVRETDVFGRYGGEEFLVLLPDTDAAGAECVAERLRWTVRRHPLALPAVPGSGPESEPGRGSVPGNGLSATVGTAVLPRDGGHAALLLRAADRALAAAREGVPAVRTEADGPTCPVVPIEDESSPPQATYRLLVPGGEQDSNGRGWE